MKSKDEEMNRIRCAIALSVPIVLNFLAKRKTDDLSEIRHLIPSYKLSGTKGSDISVYFVPADTRDTGKKRMYVNSNGYRIRYLTRKMLNRYVASMRGIYEDESVIEKMLSKITNRWVLMIGEIDGNNWATFADQLVAYSVSDHRENHPPCGDVYEAFDAYTGTPAEDNFTQKRVLDSMNQFLTLERYTPFIDGRQDATR